MIWFIIGFLIASPLFFHLGWYGKQLFELAKSIKENQKTPEPEQPATVTMGAYIPPKANYQSNQIINPKTPQQLEYETRMAVERENGRSL